MRTLPCGVSTSVKGARLHAAFGGIDAHAERGGFREDQLHDGLAVLRFGDGAEQRAGAALLHDDGLQRNIERAEFQQALGGVGQYLRVEVVDIGFDHADRKRLVGAGRLAEDDAENIRVVRKIVIARAIADCRDLHRRQYAEARGQRGGDRGASRRDQFDRGSARIDRSAGKQQRGGRGGDGKNAVLGFDGAAAHIERRADHGFDFEQIERDRGAHDIGDGIGRAHLVEVDLLDGHLMDLRFRFAELAENGDRIAARRLGEVRLLDHLDDVREVAVNFGFLYRNAVLGGADAAAFDLFEGDGSARIERCDGVGNGGLVGAGIGQGADQHIAANSRECVQIAGNRHELLL